MANDISILAPISLIEAHDGHIERIIMVSDQSTELVFDKLTVYHAVAVDRYELWLYRATLTLGNASAFSIRGLLAPDEYLDDGVIVNGEMELDWMDLLQPQPATKATITFAPGPSLEILCSSAHLSLHEPKRFLEEWIGPLVSQ